ncbi:MAG TPA: hypothetical protein PKL81_16060 [Ferruginibacter sp.]|nr:hypothetical protein [Ferruginibacter sp.]HMW27596.1 hypothetical protein [Ferruginibacter sp.]HNF03705.1 hypothetical protein [Ferruginibacter sp.]HNJ29663.1 hypothetical protein [Ferruginibacter sp.]HNJ96138.1 hypothetical protein [Ferruginibacter sp.]
MESTIELLRQELAQQKRKLNRVLLAAALLILVLSSQFLFSFREYDGNKVLKARGLVIVDDNGRERILIGAPLPGAANRVRTDTARVRELWSKRFGNPEQYMKWYRDYNHQANGILILDEQGFDKVCLGDGVPDANIGPRIGKQTGLIFCDPEGFERGGIGVLNVGEKQNRVVMALDGENGTDATGISVMEDGETGFFAGGKGYRMFLGASPADGYTPEPFFGMLINKKKQTLYKLNLVTDTAGKK